MKFITRIQILTIAACLVGSAAAAAAAAPAPLKPHEYAVISLIGDNLTIAQFSTHTGTYTNKTLRTVVPVNAPWFDDVALLAVEKAVKQADADATLDLLSSADPVLYKLQEGLLKDTSDSATIQVALRAVLKNSAAERLILVSKLRADAHFYLADSQVGEGKVEGLGYYIDNTIELSIVKTGATDIGFLAPFAYIKVSLLDARTLQVLRTKMIQESHIVSKASSGGTALNAWQVLPQKDKIEFTSELIKAAISKAIPDLLGSGPL